MSAFSVPVTVGNLKTAATETVTAEVHNRDTFSMMPASLLRRLGIGSAATVKLKRPGGRVVEYETGYATFAVEGRNGYARVIFGLEGECRIGMTTLGDLGLEVDTESGRLVRVPYLLPSLWPVNADEPDQEERHGTHG